MGIKGTVRRSTDGDFIHANIDIDLIISEENECGSLDKPVEIFYIIEHFCLGRRRYNNNSSYLKTENAERFASKCSGNEYFFN